MTCDTSSGNPINGYNYQWEWQGLTSSTITSLSTSSSSYAISGAKPEDAGNYYCLVTNAGGSQHSDPFRLDVQFTPRLKPGTVTTVAAKINTETSIKFELLANPKATMVLCKKGNDEDLPDRATTLEHEDRSWSLTFLSVQVTDYGMYSCRAQNVAGAGRFNLELAKPGPPETPSGFVLYNSTARSITVGWQSEFEGGSVQTFTVYYRPRNTEAWKTDTGIPDLGFHKNIVYKLTKLDPSTIYQIRVQAVNREAEGINHSGFTSSVAVSTKEPPYLDSDTIKVSRDDNMVTLNWGPIKGHVSSLRVRYCQLETSYCNYHGIPDPTVRSVTFKVQSGLVYSYKIEMIDSGIVAVASTERYVARPPVDEAGLSPTMIAIIATIAFVVIAVIFVVCFVYKRTKRSKTKKETTTNPMVDMSDVAEGGSNYGYQSTPAHSINGDWDTHSIPTKYVIRNGCPDGSSNDQLYPRRLENPYANLPNPDVVPDNPYQNMVLPRSRTSIQSRTSSRAPSESIYQNVQPYQPRSELIGADGTIYADLGQPQRPNSRGSSAGSRRPMQIIGDTDEPEYSIVDFKRPPPDRGSIERMLQDDLANSKQTFV